MIATSIWKQDQLFEGRSETNHTLTMDAGDHIQGPTPMEMVLMALCGCTSVDVVSILQKEARAAREPHRLRDRRASARAAPRLHPHHADLQDRRGRFAQGR